MGERKAHYLRFELSKMGVRRFGYTPEDFLSGRLTYSDIIHPDDVERVNEEAERYAHMGVSEFAQEYRIVTRSGDVRWVYDRTTVRRDERGNPVLHQGVVMDMTEKKLMEEELREREAQLRMFMDNVPALVYVLDREWRYLYVNRTYERTLKRTLEDVKGKSVFDFWPEELAQQLIETYKQVLGDNKMVSVVEKLPLEDGVHEFLSLKFPLKAFDGAAPAIAGISMDVTERRSYQRALELANKKLGLLGSVTRHDLVNTLSALVGWVEIAKDVGKDHPVSEPLARIGENVETMKKQLEFVSEYQEMGMKGSVWTPVERAWYEGVSGLDASAVRFELDTGGYEILADPLLQRVFGNLVDNSLRHGGKVRSIRLRCEEIPAGLLMVYEDDGVGIPQEDKGRLFERGYGKNMGLGLYMAKEILALTGISIAEKGEAGKGVRFEMLVPRGGYRKAKE